MATNQAEDMGQGDLKRNSFINSINSCMLNTLHP